MVLKTAKPFFEPDACFHCTL